MRMMRIFAGFLSFFHTKTPAEVAGIDAALSEIPCYRHQYSIIGKPIRSESTTGAGSQA